MLIKCPECGGQVSDKAAACPHCGMPMTRVTSQSALAGGRRQRNEGGASAVPDAPPSRNRDALRNAERMMFLRNELQQCRSEVYQLESHRSFAMRVFGNRKSARQSELENTIPTIERELQGLEDWLIRAIPCYAQSNVCIKSESLRRHLDDVQRELAALAKEYIPSEVCVRDDPTPEDISMAARGDDHDRKEWFSRLFEILPGVVLSPGWRLTSVEVRPLNNRDGFAKLFAVSDAGMIDQNVLNRISMRSPTEVDVYDVVMFSRIIERVGLSGHGIGRKEFLIPDLGQFFREFRFLSADISHVIRNLMKKDPSSFFRFDFSSEVKYDETAGQYYVTYIVYHPFSGFARYESTFGGRGGIGEVQTRVVAKIECGCGIRV